MTKQFTNSDDLTMATDELGVHEDVEAEPQVTFGAQDSMFAANAPQSVAANIGAPAPTVVQGAHHLSLVSHPAQVAASVEALVARAAPGC